MIYRRSSIFFFFFFFFYIYYRLSIFLALAQNLWHLLSQRSVTARKDIYYYGDYVFDTKTVIVILKNYFTPEKIASLSEMSYKDFYNIYNKADVFAFVWQ